MTIRPTRHCHWAVRQHLFAIALRALGAPGGGDDWRDIGTTAGVSSLAGMLLGSVAGGALAEHRTRAAAQRGSTRRKK